MQTTKLGRGVVAVGMLLGATLWSGCDSTVVCSPGFEVVRSGVRGHSERPQQLRRLRHGRACAGQTCEQATCVACHNDYCGYDVLFACANPPAVRGWNSDTLAGPLHQYDVEVSFQALGAMGSAFPHPGWVGNNLYEADRRRWPATQRPSPPAAPRATFSSMGTRSAWPMVPPERCRSSRRRSMPRTAVSRCHPRPQMEALPTAALVWSRCRGRHRPDPGWRLARIHDEARQQPFH